MTECIAAWRGKTSHARFNNRSVLVSIWFYRACICFVSFFVCYRSFHPLKVTVRCWAAVQYALENELITAPSQVISECLGVSEPQPYIPPQVYYSHFVSWDSKIYTYCPLKVNIPIKPLMSFSVWWVWWTANITSAAQRFRGNKDFHSQVRWQKSFFFLFFFLSSGISLMRDLFPTHFSQLPVLCRSSAHAEARSLDDLV